MGLVLAAAQSASLPGDIARNAAHHLRVATIAAEHGVQLLVFPELSLTGYELVLAPSLSLNPDDPVLLPLRDFAGQAKMTIVAGAPLRGEGGVLHIAAFILSPDGSVRTHTKQHVHSSEQPPFTSGTGGPVLRLNKAVAALAICADAKHPSHAANAAAQGANVYAASVMIDEPGYRLKTQLLRACAIEHRMAVLMSNYSGFTGGDQSAGKSTIWSEDGQVVAIAPPAGEALLVASRRDCVWNGSVVPVHG